MADSGGDSQECLQGPSGQYKGANHAVVTGKTRRRSKKADGPAASFMETLAPEYLNPPAMSESGSNERDMTLDDMITLDIGEDVTDPELFEMKDVLGNGTIYKKILKKGDGQRVHMHERVRVWMVSEIPSTNNVFPEQILEFVVGEGDVVQALDLSVVLMEVGEEARIFAGYKYMYGAVGMLPDVPGYSNFRIMVRLLSSETWDYDKMDIYTRLGEAKKKKDRGNFLFKRNEIDRAVQSYSLAERILDPARGIPYTKESPATLQDIVESRALILGNISVAVFKLGRYDLARSAAQKAVEIFPQYSKGYWMLGKAQEMLGKTEESIKSFKLALACDAECLPFAKPTAAGVTAYTIDQSSDPSTSANVSSSDDLNTISENFSTMQLTDGNKSKICEVLAGQRHGVQPPQVAEQKSEKKQWDLDRYTSLAKSVALLAHAVKHKPSKRPSSKPKAECSSPQTSPKSSQSPKHTSPKSKLEPEKEQFTTRMTKQDSLKAPEMASPKAPKSPKSKRTHSSKKEQHETKETVSASNQCSSKSKKAKSSKMKENLAHLANERPSSSLTSALTNQFSPKAKQAKSAENETAESIKAITENIHHSQPGNEDSHKSQKTKSPKTLSLKTKTETRAGKVKHKKKSVSNKTKRSVSPESQKEQNDDKATTSTGQTVTDESSPVLSHQESPTSAENETETPASDEKKRWSLDAYSSLAQCIDELARAVHQTMRKSKHETHSRTTKSKSRKHQKATSSKSKKVASPTSESDKTDKVTSEQPENINAPSPEPIQEPITLKVKTEKKIENESPSSKTSSQASLQSMPIKAASHESIQEPKLKVKTETEEANEPPSIITQDEVTITSPTSKQELTLLVKTENDKGTKTYSTKAKSKGSPKVTQTPKKKEKKAKKQTPEKEEHEPTETPKKEENEVTPTPKMEDNEVTQTPKKKEKKAKKQTPKKEENEPTETPKREEKEPTETPIKEENEVTQTPKKKEKNSKNQTPKKEENEPIQTPKKKENEPTQTPKKKATEIPKQKENKASESAAPTIVNMDSPNIMVNSPIIVSGSAQTNAVTAVTNVSPLECVSPADVSSVQTSPAFVSAQSSPNTAGMSVTPTTDQCVDDIPSHRCSSPSPTFISAQSSPTATKSPTRSPMLTPASSRSDMLSDSLAYEPISEPTPFPGIYRSTIPTIASAPCLADHDTPINIPTTAVFSNSAPILQGPVTRPTSVGPSTARTPILVSPTDESTPILKAATTSATRSPLFARGTAVSAPVLAGTVASISPVMASPTILDSASKPSVTSANTDATFSPIVASTAPTSSPVSISDAPTPCPILADTASPPCVDDANVIEVTSSNLVEETTPTPRMDNESVVPVLADVPEASAPSALLVQTKVTPSANETPTRAHVGVSTDTAPSLVSITAAGPMTPIVDNVTSRPVATTSMQTSPPPIAITVFPVAHISEYPHSLGTSITDEMIERERNAQHYDQYRGMRIIETAFTGSSGYVSIRQAALKELEEKKQVKKERKRLKAERQAAEKLKMIEEGRETSDLENADGVDETSDLDEPSSLDTTSADESHTEIEEHGVAMTPAGSGGGDGWSTAAKVGGAIVCLGVAGALGYGIYRYMKNK